MNKVHLDQPLAHGRTADVYAWEDGQVLKLFHNWFELKNIEYELKITRAVHASGVKSPAIGELIQVDGRNGLIYERMDGESMLEMLERKPWKVISYSHILAKNHAEMHENIFDADVPHQHAILQNKINHANALSTSVKNSLLDSLKSLPKGDRVCHGDFHPANILISGSNATVIDWIDASRGNPLADVARTMIILLGIADTNQNTFIKMFVKLFHAIYLHEYFRLCPHGKDEYRRWLPIVAAGRFSEEISELEKWLVGQAGKVP